jgi:hypothetical protein
LRNASYRIAHISDQAGDLPAKRTAHIPPVVTMSSAGAVFLGLNLEPQRTRDDLERGGGGPQQFAVRLDEHRLL